MTLKLWLRMKRKIVVSRTEDDLLVDFTFHDFSATLLTEFAEKIVRPYYSANMSEALKDLMRNAIREEDFVLDHIRAGERGDHG
jgi:hypothetical protein